MAEKKKVGVQKTTKSVARKKSIPKDTENWKVVKSKKELDEYVEKHTKTPLKKSVKKPAAKAPAKKAPVKKPAAKKKATKPKAERSPGRPTTYNDDIAVKVLVRVASGWSMRKIAAEPGMPAMSTVFLWLRNIKEFSEQYTRAKEEAADLLVEEMLDIADDATNDYMEKVANTGDGGVGVIGYMINGEFVQRSKLRIETRKWLAMKLKPKRYGDKLAVEQTGEMKVTHEYDDLSDDELIEKAKQLLKGKK